MVDACQEMQLGLQMHKSSIMLMLQIWEMQATSEKARQVCLFESNRLHQIHQSTLALLLCGRNWSRRLLLHKLRLSGLEKSQTFNSNLEANFRARSIKGYHLNRKDSTNLLELSVPL